MTAATYFLFLLSIQLWIRFAISILSSILHLIYKCIWMGGGEGLVAPHEGDEVFGVGEVGDVVGVARYHFDYLDAVAGDFEIQDFVGSFFAQLYESMAFHYDEFFVLGVMPMLSFGDAGFGDVDGELSGIGRADDFGE